MRQTIVTVAFEVQPGSVDVLEQAISAFRIAQEQGPEPNYGRLKDAVPMLHFMSMMVFRDTHYDPILLIEANFDGEPQLFWQSFAAAFGAELKDMLGCCAAPRDSAAAARFNALVNDGQGLAEALEAASVWPTASHLGNRGLTRAQIEAESEVFNDIQARLAADAEYRARTPVEIHGTLRRELLPARPWLNEPSSPRILSNENRQDWVNALFFFTLVAAVLAIPGAVAALVLPAWLVGLLGVLAIFLLMPRLAGIDQVAPKLPVWALVVAVIVLALISAVIWLGLASLALWALAGIAAAVEQRAAVPPAAWMHGALLAVLAGALCAPAALFGVLAWLRRLENQDSTSLAPLRDEDLLRGIAQREDQNRFVYQNHMGSIVLVKTGGLRSLLLRVGHRALHLMLRLVARDGYLSDMRTVHFAHWALLNNNSRLLFMSNFDGTWDSYLDDFIEKAHKGTTLAWTNCIGAPLAKFLMLEGMTRGRQFKAWARSSMAPNLFWFSAYPMLTVNQIERNHVIAEGLRRSALGAGEAEQWTRWL